jgi:hypothetical protein
LFAIASQGTVNPVTSQPRKPLTLGGKDGTADRFRGYLVYLPADFSKMTSFGISYAEPVLSSSLNGSAITNFRSTTRSQ